MDKKIKIAIAGYGNLGRAAIACMKNFPDMELAVVFTRRTEAVKAPCPVHSFDDMPKFRGKIDVTVMCGGSASDLPAQSPAAAKIFNIVDSFDTHARIPEHFANVEKAARGGGTFAVISAGWDPGLFSLMRALFAAVLPDGGDYSFWGKGVSQGHSDAIRRVSGVKKAIQYSIPVGDAVQKVRQGLQPVLSAREKHLRECFVVAQDGADKARIEREIKQMPNYFADYDTTVHFITEEEFDRAHTAMPHAGLVLRSGETAGNNKHLMELSLKMDSNPEFTASVMLAYARAVKRLHDEGRRGCATALDIPVGYLSIMTGEELRGKVL